MLGLLIVVAGYLAIGVVSYFVILTVSIIAKVLVSGAPKDSTGWQELGQEFGKDPVTSYIGVFPSFVAIILLLWLVVHFLHKRPFLSLITSRKKMNWHHVLIGFVVCGGLTALTNLVGYFLYANHFSLCFRAREFLAWAPMILLLTPIQCLAEEMLLRGYLLQGIGLWVQRYWLLTIINGLVFCLLHLNHPVMKTHAAAVVAFFYFCFGCLSTIVALRSNGLEMPVGMHIANNLFYFLILTEPDTVIIGPSIFKINQRHEVFDAISTLLNASASYVLLMLYLRRDAKKGLVPSR